MGAQAMIMQQLEPGDLWAPAGFPGDPTIDETFPARIVAAVDLSASSSDTKLLIRAHASGTIVRESSGARAVGGSVLNRETRRETRQCRLDPSGGPSAPRGRGDQ